MAVSVTFPDHSGGSGGVSTAIVAGVTHDHGVEKTLGGGCHHNRCFMSSCLSLGKLCSWEIFEWFELEG